MVDETNDSIFKMMDDLVSHLLLNAEENSIPDHVIDRIITNVKKGSIASIPKEHLFLVFDALGSIAHRNPLEEGVYVYVAYLFSIECKPK